MEVLGVGSTSTCHRCVDKRTNLHYACKIIDKKLIEDRFQGMMEQFHTEIEALRSLDHPNIIQLLDVYITEGKIFIVMELMEGGELFDYVVQKGTLTEDEAATIVRKVTSALVYMHSKNIVHRDLKPENLLLRRVPKSSHDSIEVKIIDFGLSKVGEKVYNNRRIRSASFSHNCLSSSVWKSQLHGAFLGRGVTWHRKCCNAETIRRQWIPGHWVLLFSFYFVDVCPLMTTLKLSPVMI